MHFKFSFALLKRLVRFLSYKNKLVSSANNFTLALLLINTLTDWLRSQSAEQMTTRQLSLSAECVGYLLARVCEAEKDTAYCVYG